MAYIHKNETLSGWGRAPSAQCLSYRPEKQRDLPQLLGEHRIGLVARGLGRSYGDAALNPEGVVRMERLDHCLAFDEDTGLLSAQAGVTLSDIMALFIPRGFLPPVIPGTRHVTLGGAFASNVHGKNHLRMGDFAEHVTQVQLVLPTGERVSCSRDENAELFWATAGGMGMTGIIESLTLRLRRIASASLESVRYRVDSMEDMIAAFEHYRESHEYLVGWIDHMARGEALGQGIFEAANHAPAGDDALPFSDYTPPQSRLSVPFSAPSFLLNRMSMALYNKLRFRGATDEREHAIIDFSSFFHPLDRIGHWNRLYGARGFYQYQCVLPESPNIAAHLREFLALIQQRGQFSFLAVLKAHRESQGMLSFPLAGYSLALDFPSTDAVRALLPLLDEWVQSHGGRIYLAKDAALSPDAFARMYGARAEQWQAFIRALDPEARLSSLMSRRLQWKPAA